MCSTCYVVYFAHNYAFTRFLSTFILLYIFVYRHFWARFYSPVLFHVLSLCPVLMYVFSAMPPRKFQQERKSKPRRPRRGPKQLQDKLLKSPNVDVVSLAVAALCNNEWLREEKDGVTLTEQYPKEILALAKGMFRSGRVYKFQLHFQTPFAASVAGATAGDLPWSPAITSYPEWSALSALFDEVKIINSTIMWTSTLGWGLVSSIPVQFALAPDNTSNNTIPTGFTAVQRLAESHIFQSNVPQASGGATLKKKHKVPRREWATTLTPAVLSPPAGCVGQWSWGGSNAGTNSFIYAQIAMTNVFAFRSRA